MQRPSYRSAYWSVGALAAALVIAAPRESAADPVASPAALASMQCDRASEPGRVRCTVEARVGGGATLAWADVAIVGLPDFATALKGRLAKDDATSRDAASTRWAFGVVARKAGQGDARARVRLVACTGDGRCTPHVVDVHALLVVGPG